MKPVDSLSISEGSVRSLTPVCLSIHPRVQVRLAAYHIVVSLVVAYRTVSDGAVVFSGISGDLGRHAE